MGRGEGRGQGEGEGGARGRGRGSKYHSSRRRKTSAGQRGLMEVAQQPAHRPRRPSARRHYGRFSRLGRHAECAPVAARVKN